MVSSFASYPGDQGLFQDLAYVVVCLGQAENLPPLLFSLCINDLEEYLLALEEYLLAKGNNFIDFKDEICNNYVKLLV